jgi:hypothetical protein
MGHFWPFFDPKMVKKGGPFLSHLPDRSNVNTVHFGPKGVKKGGQFLAKSGQKWVIFGVHF